MMVTASPDIKSETTKYLHLLKAFNEFFKQYKDTFVILDFNTIRSNLDNDRDKEKLADFEISYKNMLLKSEALWFQELYNKSNFILVEAERKIQALQVKPKKSKKQKSENDERLKKIEEQKIVEEVKKELSFFLEQLPTILKTTTTLIDLMMGLTQSALDHRDIETNLKREKKNMSRISLGNTFIDTVGRCTFQGISRFAISLDNINSRMGPILSTDELLKIPSQLCIDTHSLWQTKLKSNYDSKFQPLVPEATLELGSKPEKHLGREKSKRGSTNFGQENPKLLVICNQLLQEIVKIKNANGSNSIIELHRVLEEIEQEIIDAFLNRTEPGILDTFKEKCQGILERISTHGEYFNLINALDVPITLNRDSKSKNENFDNKAEEFYSNFKPEDVEKYKDTIEKKFLEKAIEFLNRYFSANKFCFYKNAWKKKLTSDLKDQFNLLYKMSYVERQNYILNNQCANIWQVCIHIMKKAFLDYGKSHKTLSRGNFKIEFEKGLAYFEKSRPKNIPLTTDELLTGSIGDSKLPNPDLKITGNSPVVLLSIVLRVNDYYQNTLLGNKICSTFDIEENDSDSWKDEVENLCSRLINLYVQNPNISLQSLLTDLENTINSIRGHFAGTSGWFTNGSRLAGTLEQIHDLFSNSNTKKYDVESLALDTKILESVKIDDVNQANLYIRQHIINQAQQRFGTYNDTVSHRLLARTDTEKLFTFNQISDRLIKLQSTQEINSEITVRNVIENIYSIFDDELMICGKIQAIYCRGEFDKSYSATNSYLNTLLSKLKNPVLSDKDSLFIAKISDFFNNYSYEKSTELNPVFWRQSLARTIKVKLNNLYKSDQKARNDLFGSEGVEKYCEKILRQSLIEHNHTLDTVDADFKQAMQAALTACNQTIVQQGPQNGSSVDLSKIKVESTQKKPFLLVGFILKISDYYCNSPLAKPLCDKYPGLTLNNSFGWQNEIQALANIMLKQYLRTNQNLDTEMPRFLTHLKHVITDIESKPFSADSRLLTTLKFVYNQFLPTGGASTQPYVIKGSILPTVLFNELEEGKIQKPTVHQNYIALHVITQLSELYATYEDSVAKCWSTTTKPMKLITAEKVRNSLEQLKLECADKTSVEIILEKVADIFVQHHSMLDHIMPIFYQKKEPGFFQSLVENEYSKMYGKVVQYLRAICPDTLSDKLQQKMEHMTRVAPAALSA